ncbi:MAG: hypothetical protein F4X36_12410 [Gammaproteobacteria bacterium]|nr:hypothetical protein [Gammaproteobacteria bacterium]
MARHRVKRSASGLRRVEVTVPAGDAALIRTAAAAFRRGGEEADRLREALAPALSTARTGMELVAFLRASPLVGEDLVFERDRSVGREADLEGLEIPE